MRLTAFVLLGLLTASCAGDGTNRSATAGPSRDRIEGAAPEPADPMSGPSVAVNSSPPDPPSAPVQSVQAGEPVTGNVYVTWKNLNPASRAGAFSLVNQSSEYGRKLTSGKATSTEIRVIDDVQMGTLVAELRRVGFFQFAKPGLGLGNIPEGASRSGVVVVQQDGKDLGLLFRATGPGPEANAYTECKKLVLAVHGSVPSFEVRVGSGEGSDRVFEAPPIKPRRIK
jgi:hypothetical protein